MKENVLNIMRVDWARALSPHNQQALQRQMQVIPLQEPGPVIHKGQAVSGAYLVLEGELRVYTYTTKGTEATLYRLQPGQTCILTLNCLFNDLRYPAWVESTQPSRVAMIPGALYRRLFAEEAAVRDTTVQALSTLVFRLMDELEELHSCGLEQRLVAFLLNRSTESGALNMTQQQLANHLGTTREVVARLLQNLTQNGLVKTGRGRIVLTDSSKLAALLLP